MKRPKAPAILCRLTLLLMLFAMTPRAMAQQQINVSGIVTDPSGEPIIGASVIAGNSGNGTATNIDGEYTIKADPLGEIRFSYIGYTPFQSTGATPSMSHWRKMLPCSTKWW